VAKQNARRNLQNRKRRLKKLRLSEIITRQRVNSDPIIRDLARDLECSPMDVFRYATESVRTPKEAWSRK